MNAIHPSKCDEALRKLLQEWRVDAALPLRFHKQVWHRIDAHANHQ